MILKISVEHIKIPFALNLSKGGRDFGMLTKSMNEWKPFMLRRAQHERLPLATTAVLRMLRCVLIALMIILLFSGTLYADEMRMPENTPRPLKIGVAVFVNNITKVNDQAGTFEGGLDLQLRWKNVDLAFNAQEMGTNRLEFEHDSAVQKLASIWTPALTLANVAIQSKEQGLFIYADGTVVHIQRLKCVFDAQYRLDAFPFDTQNLPVHIVSERYNTNQIVLVQEQRDLDNSGLRKDMSLLFWQPKRIKFVASRTRGWNGQFFPEMQAQIVLARVPTAHLLATLMPFFLVMLIPTIGTFFIRMDMDKRLGYISSSILAPPCQDSCRLKI